ncbi:uncharacterized protein LOC143327360 [Chaetodon auriga]|uniref:uncharacterized protein LOC143327360 n=1 Tax=Chaetodon auriga TaxID=39042 RepID=UPI004032A5E5
MCPCSVVYSIKFLLRAESPRDYTDLLLSWKHIPNVCIYDFARGLATHANLRNPENVLFTPHEGRLLEPTADNIRLAKEGHVKVDLPWLKEKKQLPDTGGHPLTGSSEHYVLYDKFHEDNTKDASDVLRRIELVPQLAGWVNSQAAEQLFSDMKKNNYFLNVMTPSAHIILMRNILHHYNTSVNKRFEKMYRTLTMDITLNMNGQAVMGSPENLCGEHCERRTKASLLRPCRETWTLPGHPLQEELIDYILDDSKPAEELIIKDGHTCLTRDNMQTLGQQREMDSMVCAGLGQ